MLREDLVQLLPDDPRAAGLARRVCTLAEVLDTVDFRVPAAVGSDPAAISQPHCHQQAVLGLAADRRVRAANGIAVADELAGCCGLAGNFGAERGHEAISRAVAELSLMPALEAHPDAPVLADGFSCRTQIEALSGRRARHLAEVLADRL
jgi:Fe-S oxidoreductase